jgi:hypothetical protein
MTNLRSHAVSYADLGLEVFPLRPDKTPYTEHGNKDGTTDLDTVEAWWRRWPDALIGHRIAPDHVLLDIDPRHGGKATWKALRAELRDFTTRTHYSGRGDGGGHVWFGRPDGKLSTRRLDEWAQAHEVGTFLPSGKWSAGIDLLRREHRYSILPPSPHPEGGGAYRWAPSRGLSCAVVAMPMELSSLLIETPETGTQRAMGGSESDYRMVDSIADWFSSTHAWTDLLGRAGWELVGWSDGNSDGSLWRHPGATNEHSATIRHGQLFVYSPNTVFEVTETDDPHGYTPFRAWAILEHGGDLAAAGRAARALKDGLTPPRVNAGPTDDEARRVVLTPASAIELRRVRWCWRGRLPLGMLGLLAGPEGLGKSTVACTLGASLTRGELEGEYEGRPRAVIVCATEDSWRHTIAPRFHAAGADLDRVFRVEAQDAGLTLPLSLPDDLGELAEQAAQVDAGLLIFDPLISRLNKRLDSHKDAEVRGALEPLVAFAETADLAILGLIHHNKSGSNNPLELVMASKAFTAVARSVHTVIRDPDDDTGQTRVFGTAKNNLGTLDLTLLAFRIEGWSFTAVDGMGETGQLQWLGERAGTLGGLIEQERSPALTEAIEWLRDYIAAHGGEVDARSAKLAADGEGIVTRTLERASKLLGVIRKRTGYQGKVRWSLHGETVSPNPPVLPCGEYGETEDDQGIHSRQESHTRHKTAPRAREGESNGDQEREIEPPELGAAPYMPSRPICPNCGAETIGSARQCSYCLTPFGVAEGEL